MLVNFQVGEGQHRIDVVAVKTDNGYTVSLTGGDYSHVGAVALGVPRASLSDESKISATVSVLTLIGHKDDEIARPTADRLARLLKQPVVVVAGIHVGPHDAYIATKEDISKIMENCKTAVEELIQRLGVSS